MMFRSEIVTTLEQFEAYRLPWNQIVNDINNRNPFMEFDWIMAWWRIKGQARNIEIYVVFEGEHLRGFAPMEKNIIKKNRIEYAFLAKGDASYMDILSKDLYKKAVWQLLLPVLLSGPEQKILSLHGLVETDQTSLALEWFLQKNAITYDFTRVVAPLIDLVGIDKESYFHKRRKSFGLNKSEALLAQQGEVTFRELKDVEYEKIYELFDARWQMKKDTSGFSAKKNKAFHQELVNTTKLLSVEGLFLDDELVAFTLGYRLRGVYTGSNMAFQPDLFCFGLGNILDKKLIRSSFDKEDTLFDFSIGYEKYKFSWATDTKYLRQYIFGNTAAKKQVKLKNLLALSIQQIKKNEKIVAFKRNKLAKWLYYIKKPLELIKSCKKMMHGSLAEIYYLKAHHLPKEEMAITELSLVDLMKLDKKDKFIGNCNKGMNYFETYKQSIYGVNRTIMHKENWVSTIELPQDSVYIEGDIQKDVLSLWNEQNLYMTVGVHELMKKKELKKIGFQKITSIHTFSLLKVKLFSSKKLKRKSSKRYQFIAPVDVEKGGTKSYD